MWELCVPSTPAGIRLYVGDIVSGGILPALESSHWAVKQKAGQAIQEVAGILAASELEAHCKPLLLALEAALASSRGLWAGKEDLVLAFAAVLCTCGSIATDVYVGMHGLFLGDLVCRVW